MSRDDLAEEWRFAAPKLVSCNSWTIRRKSGESSFNVGPRDFSKKQKRRRKKLGVRRSLVQNHAKVKRTEKFLSRKYDKDKLDEMIAEMRGNLEDVVKDLSLPESKSLLLASDDNGEPTSILQFADAVDPDKVLDVLRKEKFLLFLISQVQLL